VKPRNQAVIRIAATLTSIAGFIGVASVVAPAAQAFPTEACRQYPAWGSHGVGIRPCIDYIWDYQHTGANDWAWEAQTWAYSPQTDVRVYEQVGWSATATQQPRFDGPVVSQVVGPSSSWVHVTVGNGDVDVMSGCWWAHSWVVDGTTTILSDVESPPICTNT
jgi:hypothetical protein